jgi:flagellar hook protein FlgE
MSLFGSLTTAISGLNAQSSALGYISDNVANSQTTGFKRVDANFVDYITSSSRTEHEPGAVLARPQYTNAIQGTLQQTQNPLALAIGGQGFFAVAQQNGTANGAPTFDARPFYTRAGDFQMSRDGYLVNGSGYFLEGWAMNGAGQVDRTSVQPIQITQQTFNPIATANIDLSANLPGDATTSPVSTQAQVYDTLGRQHTITLTFTPTSTNNWSMAVDVPDDIAARARGGVNLQFGRAASPAVTDGTIGGLTGATGSVVPTGTTATGQPASFTFTTDFGQGPQTVTMNLGNFGSATGLTQFTGTQFTPHSMTQDGVPPGAYAGIAIRDNGDVVVNYDNGQSRTLARVPVVAFNEPGQLQRLDGQAFQATTESGAARLYDASSNGVGKLVVGSTEASNVDIATEFSKLIVAQRAYSANTKIVTTTDQMLQDTINMAR